MNSNEDILKAIAQYGSVRKAAIALSISPQAISKRFSALPDNDPIKQSYAALCGKKGRPRKYEQGIEGDRVRVKEAVRRYRAKQG